MYGEPSHLEHGTEELKGCFCVYAVVILSYFYFLIFNMEVLVTVDAWCSINSHENRHGSVENT